MTKKPYITVGNKVRLTDEYRMLMLPMSRDLIRSIGEEEGEVKEITDPIGDYVAYVKWPNHPGLFGFNISDLLKISQS